jgi:hypothetical protein
MGIKSADEKRGMGGRGYYYCYWLKTKSEGRIEIDEG